MSRYINRVGITKHRLTCLFRVSGYSPPKFMFACSCAVSIPPVFNCDEKDFPIGADLQRAEELLSQKPKGYIVMTGRDVFPASAKVKGCGCANHNSPSNTLDLVGERFGRLVVVKKGSNRPKKKKGDSYTTQICNCDCGNSDGGIYRTDDLRSGKTVSCGCYRSEQAKENNTTHGQSQTREYRSWAGMKQRCLNPQSDDYSDYGGRGITIDANWVDSFENFYAEMGECPDGDSLDRIDVNDGYFSENCRWANNYTQANNKRSNRTATAFGLTYSVAEWSFFVGISSRTLVKRLNIGGKSIEEILLTPSRSYSKKSDARALLKSLKARCNNPNNISYKYYGAKGISYDPRWRNYDCFIRDVGERPSPAHQIDRIDRNGDYEKNNVRWVLPLQQANNTSRNCYSWIEGEWMNALEASQHFGFIVKPKLAVSRIGKGWDPVDAFTIPSRRACTKK